MLFEIIWQKVEKTIHLHLSEGVRFVFNQINTLEIKNTLFVLIIICIRGIAVVIVKLELNFL